MSQMEPELGLGIVQRIEKRSVEIYFPSAACSRLYARATAPLQRVEFQQGDMLQTHAGKRFKVISVALQNNLYYYHAAEGDFPENEVSTHASYSTPQRRLLSGSLDDQQEFILRYRSLMLRQEAVKSDARGFLGGRIDLLPHQLYVAHATTSLHLPRVLLSDETGLGKTIEACLIIHRLILSERITRVLILVPSALIHQWFIELFRRFNLFFQIFDDDFCRQITEKESTLNPFCETQLGICSIEFLIEQDKWHQAAVAAGWDLLIIDEAHHLLEGSPEYDLVRALCRASAGLLLLTATPEQLGRRHHFARLQLLDPSRYHNFELFEQEEDQYLRISALVEKLVADSPLNIDDTNLLISSLPHQFASGQEQWDGVSDWDENRRRLIVQELVDRFGAGRSVFRNTRAALGGFPQRQVDIVALTGDDLSLTKMKHEFFNTSTDQHASTLYHYDDDPRLLWLVEFLRSRQKVLLLCSSLLKVQAIAAALRKRIKIEIALFHENQTLIQRDRFAAWFAQSGGAQILLCSEIGSEGRNFQFAQHLVLYDLPLNPELLEQRIGRLDRIGQKGDITIHVPFLVNSEYEVLVRWYHEGLDAFRQNVPGAFEIYRQLGEQVLACTRGENRQVRLSTLLQSTREIRAEIEESLEKGKDRLLQINSFHQETASRLLRSIQTAEAKAGLQKFMLDVFDHYGINWQPLSERTFQLDTVALTDPHFPLPLMKQEEFIVTFDRRVAIIHEDYEFLTWDHPMVIGVLELVLGSDNGNCTVVVWPDKEHSTDILLETVFVLECIAPKSLPVNRFLPPQVLRVIVDQSGK
ncbi:MAG: RNA polymerase-associated protein RapA, partial [Calditrichaeota bacterium]